MTITRTLMVKCALRFDVEFFDLLKKKLRKVNEHGVTVLVLVCTLSLGWYPYTPCTSYTVCIFRMCMWCTFNVLF